MQSGVYLFINGHIYAPQITLLRVMNGRNVETTDSIPPASLQEVIISGNNNNIVFSANGMRYGHIFRLFMY